MVISLKPVSQYQPSWIERNAPFLESWKDVGGVENTSVGDKPAEESFLLVFRMGWLLLGIIPFSDTVCSVPRGLSLFRLCTLLIWIHRLQ